MTHRPIRLLYAGALSRGELCRVRYDALERLGAEVHPFDYTPYERKIAASLFLRIVRKLNRPIVNGGFNADLVRRTVELAPDVLYVDKGLDIERSSLVAIRRGLAAAGRRILILHFHPDHAFHPLLHTRAYEGAVPEYDCHFIPHPWVIDEHHRRGARRVVYLPFGFDPQSHFREWRFDPTDGEPRPDVVFIGRWESVRGAWIRELAGCGVQVDLWGPWWPRRAAGQAGLRCNGGFADFATQRRAFGRAKISLGMLSTTNLDGHTSRTFEIPSCGGFMLGERTTGQCEFFEEGREMGGFAGPQELQRKVRYYLEHEQEREAIREAGYRRCVGSGYDYDSRMRRVLEEVARIDPALAAATDLDPGNPGENPEPRDNPQPDR